MIGEGQTRQVDAHVRYNDTVQDRIRLENNSVVPRFDDDDLDTARRRAGLEAPYRDKLLP